MQWDSAYYGNFMEFTCAQARGRAGDVRRVQEHGVQQRTRMNELVSDRMRNILYCLLEGRRNNHLLLVSTDSPRSMNARLTESLLMIELLHDFVTTNAWVIITFKMFCDIWTCFWNILLHRRCDQLMLKAIPACSEAKSTSRLSREQPELKYVSFSSVMHRLYEV